MARVNEINIIKRFNEIREKMEKRLKMKVFIDTPRMLPKDNEFPFYTLDIVNQYADRIELLLTLWSKKKIASTSKCPITYDVDTKTYSLQTYITRRLN